MGAILLFVALAQSGDRLDAALWYSKQTKEQVDKIETKIDDLTISLRESQGRITAVEKDVRRLETQQAKTEGEIRSLELWRSESTGKITIFGAGLALLMGLATSIFNRWWAKSDRRRGK